MGAQALTALRFSKRTPRSTGEIADDGELGERGETDGLVGSFFLQRVDEGGTCHAGAAIDEHGAGAADLFEAVGVVGDGGGGRAAGGDGVERDLAENRGDVHVGAIRDGESLGARGGVGGGLAEYLDVDGGWHGWCSF